MEAEFDRLDKDKKRQLAVKELTQSKLRVSHFANVWVSDTLNKKVGPTHSFSFGSYSRPA
jgi:hypothetical protein